MLFSRSPRRANDDDVVDENDDMLLLPRVENDWCWKVSCAASEPLLVADLADPAREPAAVDRSVALFLKPLPILWPNSPPLCDRP